MRLLLAIVIAYFIGAVSFAWLVAKSQGVDIFSVGSGNAGFTNVLRTMGFKYASIVLAGDILKGTLAAAIGFKLAGEWGMLAASAMAIIGHTFSCFIGFKGGKGVATGAGVLLFISPPSFLICALALSSLAYFTGYMSVGSLTAVILCPILLFVTGESPLVVTVFTVCALFVIWMHRTNIARLRNGTENKIRMRKR